MPARTLDRPGVAVVRSARNRRMDHARRGGEADGRVGCADRSAARAHDAGRKGGPAHDLRRPDSPSARLSRQSQGESACRGALVRGTRRPRRRAVQRLGSCRRARNPACRGGTVAPRHSVAVWRRRHPRLSHGVSDPVGRGGEFRARARSADRARGGDRGHRRRIALELCADGGRRARPALGAGCGGLRRRRLPRQAVRGRARGGVSGRLTRERRLDVGHAEALRRIRRRQRRHGLQPRRDFTASAARDSPAAVQSSLRRRCAHDDERVQRRERCAGEREPRAAHDDPPRSVGLRRIRGFRLHRRHGAHRARLCGRSARGDEARIPRGRRHEHAERLLHEASPGARAVGRSASSQAR